MTGLGSGVNICTAGRQMCSEPVTMSLVPSSHLLFFSSNELQNKQKHQNPAKTLLKLEKKLRWNGFGCSAPLLLGGGEMCGDESILFLFSPSPERSGMLVRGASKAAERQIFSDYTPFARGSPPEPPPCAAKMDNSAHFCGFSETPNQTFKQMIS